MLIEPVMKVEGLIIQSRMRVRDGHRKDFY